jgi:lipopolysaccharide/colanic/teichoic acid biosynthesis glycosyltransferase
MLTIVKKSAFIRFLIRKKAYITGFVVHLLSYLISIAVKRGGLIFNNRDILYVIIIMVVPFFFALLFEKYNSRRQLKSLELKLKTYFYSFLFSLGSISMVITTFFSQDVSRFVVFGSHFISFIIEITILLWKGNFQFERNLKLSYKFSTANFIVELLIYWGSFLLVCTYMKWQIPPFISYPFIYSGCFLTWLISALLIHNFNSIKGLKSVSVHIWMRIKVNLIFTAVVSFIAFTYHVDKSMYTAIVSFMALYFFASICINAVISVFYRPAKSDEIRGSFKAISEYKENINLAIGTVAERYNSPTKTSYSPYLSEQLVTVYLRKFPGVYEFISGTLNLTTFDFRRCVMIRSADVFNVEILPELYIEFYMNLHEINDIKNINDYFCKINQCLLPGGYYVGRVEPTHLRFERFLHNYPYHLARIFYFVDFIWRRIFPNMPFLRKIYFAFSNGKKRVISFSEVLGRLYYCGFEICHYKQFSNYIYFIGRKVKETHSVGNPVYGPLIKLKRIGKKGKVVNIYKFRTMHPYSEFIQKFIYDKNNLDDGGKIKNDFRVTAWGHILRKFWLDELPMFINLLKGDLKLVGVRPISQHYLSIYSDELRELRAKYKPGILPPFYYDMPKTLDEIMESEKRYLALYEKYPFRTDVKYFFVILYNIFIKKARSK